MSLKYMKNYNYGSIIGTPRSGAGTVLQNGTPSMGVKKIFDLCYNVALK